MKNLTFLTLAILLANSGKAQEWKLPIKDYVVIYNATSTHATTDTGRFLLLRVATITDTIATLYQEIQNNNGVVVNKPSNIKVPRTAVKLLFDNSYNLPAINAFLAAFYIEAINENE